MMLTHTCPCCKIEHDMDCTPEPDQLCPECMIIELDRAKPMGQPDEREEKQKPIISINPPPKDRRCECCHKHISELKPFGKAGDPLVGDFDGQLLVKNFRAMMYHNEEADAKIKAVTDEMQKIDGHIVYVDYEKKLIEKYGEKEAMELDMYDQAISTVSASWECRDCFILDGEEFYNKRDEMWKKRQEGK